MSAKLIFSDIDGTLITSQGVVSSTTIEAIRKQIIAGNLFIPVSARFPKGIMNVVDKITNEEDREKEEIKKRQLVEKVSNIRDRWGSMSPEEQREVLHEAIKQITITHNKINIDFNL